MNWGNRRIGVPGWYGTHMNNLAMGCIQREVRERKEKLERIQSTKFGKYQYQRVCKFADTLKGLGFRDMDGGSYSNSYGGFSFVSNALQVWSEDDNGWDDVIVIRGTGVEDIKNRGGKGIMLSLLLNRALNASNLIGIACTRAFRMVNDEVSYDISNTTLPDTETLERYYEWGFDWKKHPHLKGEVTGRPLIWYVPNGYKRNPHKYEKQ